MSEVDIQKKIGQFLDSALKKFIVQDYNEAIRELKAAEVLDKENPEILYNLGVNYSRLGLFKTAIGYFKKVLKLKHTFVDILVVKKLLAYALINIKDYTESEKYLDEAIKTSPSDIAAMNMKGYCLDIKGMHMEALKVYRSIIEIEKNNYTAYNSLSYIISKTDGDLNESLKFAKIAYESNRVNPAYLDTLGFVYMKMGRLESANKYLNMAIKIAPLSDEIKGHKVELEKLKASG